MEVIRSCFRDAIPWNKSIKQVVIKRFEIIGIPIHLWNNLTIDKIGSCIVEIIEVHPRMHNLINAEVSIKVNEEMRLIRRVKVKEGGNTFNTWIQPISIKEDESIVETQSDFSKLSST